MILCMYYGEYVHVEHVIIPVYSNPILIYKYSEADILSLILLSVHNSGKFLYLSSVIRLTITSI